MRKVLEIWAELEKEKYNAWAERIKRRRFLSVTHMHRSQDCMNVFLRIERSRFIFDLSFSVFVHVQVQTSQPKNNFRFRPSFSL